MWYLCGSESLSVRCTLPAGDKHVVIVKLGHYITYQLAFLSNSQIRSFRAYSLVSQAYLLVNEPRKTNVCFAAACFSLRLIISQIRNARELVHLRRICERQNRKAQCATDAKHLDFGVIISQIRNARYLDISYIPR